MTDPKVAPLQNPCRFFVGLESPTIKGCPFKRPTITERNHLGFWQTYGIQHKFLNSLSLSIYFPINVSLEYNNRDIKLFPICIIFRILVGISDFRGIVGMLVEHKVLCMPGVKISASITAPIYSEPYISSFK